MFRHAVNEARSDRLVDALPEERDLAVGLFLERLLQGSEPDTLVYLSIERRACRRPLPSNDLSMTSEKSFCAAFTDMNSVHGSGRETVSVKAASRGLVE